VRTAANREIGGRLRRVNSSHPFGSCATSPFRCLVCVIPMCIHPSMAAGVQRLFLIIGTAMHPRLSITPLGLICAAGLAAAVGGGVLLAAARPATQPNPAATMPTTMPPGTTVVARVDGTELHLSDVEAAQQSLPPQVQKMQLAPIYPMLLDRLLHR